MSYQKDIYQNELDLFLSYKFFFESSRKESFFELDTYGFALSPQKNDLNLFITGLTHGNEVIGLQVINLILEHIKIHNIQDLSIGFLLNNIEAYLINSRFKQNDLNRSFLRDSKPDLTYEHSRARQIEKILSGFSQIDLLIDLHQTSEPCEKAFIIIPEDYDLIEMASYWKTDFPIITFSLDGFSVAGKTLTEFVQEKLGKPALVFELGEKGFNADLAQKMQDLLLNLSPKTLKSHLKSGDEIRYHHIVDKIPILPEVQLVPGLKNLSYLTKSLVLAQNKEHYLYECPYEAHLVFPRYKNITSQDTELGLLAVEKKYVKP